MDKRNYQDFLKSKTKVRQAAGFDVTAADVHPMLYDWQREIVAWAVRLGRAALFEECGLGKTLQQLEWARLISERSGGRVLILLPLAVAAQTVAEGKKIGVAVEHCRHEDNPASRIVCTNYEMLKNFKACDFAGVVLDESSILKSFTGQTKRAILQAFEKTPYKLACTATPAPNDHLELGNHADFLGVMPSNEMIMRWFINDTMAAGSYRLKKHAVGDFWRWVTSWAVCISKPSDLGSQFSDKGFILPELRLHNHVVEVDHTRAFADEKLFVDGELSATQMWKEKRLTVDQRCELAARIAASRPDEPWIIWCDTNDEADKLKFHIPWAVEVRGSDTAKDKERHLNDFSEGRARIIITKPDIAGFGLNWQHCRNQVFVGVTYSFEKMYQALRRSWRFGQSQPVDAYVIYAESEGNIAKAITDKQEAHRQMQTEMVTAMKETGLQMAVRRELNMEISEGITFGDNWTMHLGDCVQTAGKFPDDSIDFTLFSPPFSNLYIYSDSVADMGNTADDQEFMDQFEFLIEQLHRITVPGRLCAVHCKDLPLYMNRDGAAGLRDFPGEIVRRFEKHGWVYHSRVTIWKDPVIEMQRTKNHGLLYKNFQVRGEVVRQGMADFIVVFRKWADDRVSLKPVIHAKDDYPLDVWQRYASPVWMDIDQTNVLNYQIAREGKDEKHICPLQLDVIERCIRIWTNPGDLVLSPFAGIGSEGFEAIRLGRKFVGIELKKAYFDIAVENLKRAEREAKQEDLFTGMEADKVA